jgi:ATP-dependent Clp protease adaptor protein ClpS
MNVFFEFINSVEEIEAPPKPKTRTRKKETPQSSDKDKPFHTPQFHVILLDDDDHTYEYVMEMLGAIFGYGRAKAFRMACEVDFTGRVIVFTGHKERAETKRDQIHAYGADWRIPHCKGSMSAIVEPAEMVN